MAKLPVLIPFEMPAFSSVGAPSNVTLNTIGDLLATITIAEEDATITKVSHYHDVTTSAGSSGTVRVGIQSVNTSGLPSGTWLGFGDFTLNTTNFPNFATTQKTLSSSASITRGQYYATVIQCLSGTFGAADNIKLYTSRGTGIGHVNRIFPYQYSVVGGVAGAKSTGSFIPLASCASATREYGYAYSASIPGSFSSTATPNEIGNKFKLPAGITTSFKISGVSVAVGPTNSASTFDMKLYDSANTVLQSASFTNTAAYNFNTVGFRTYYFTNSSLTALTPNTDYRITFTATNASGTFGYSRVGPGYDISPSLIPGGLFHFTSRNSPAAFTDSTTECMSMVLIIDDMTASTSSGGLVVHPGMSGGMRS